jgi:hypothetical protein
MGKHVHNLSEIDPEERTAVCSNCGPVQIVSGGRYKGERRWRCKIIKRQHATSERRQEWYKTYQKEYYERTSGASQRKAWLKRYGLTVEDFERMEAEQDGKCAICRRSCATGQNLSVDHCHDSLKVRGLLCRNCNRAIGLLEDNVEWLANAIDYLTQP